MPSAERTPRSRGAPHGRSAPEATGRHGRESAVPNGVLPGAPRSSRGSVVNGTRMFSSGSAVARRNRIPPALIAATAQEGRQVTVDAEQVAVGGSVAVDIERHHQGGIGVGQLFQFVSLGPLEAVTRRGAQEVRDFHLLPFLVDLEVGGREVRYRFPPAVRHVNVDVHDIDCHLVDDRRRRRVRALRLLCGHLRGGQRWNRYEDGRQQKRAAVGSHAFTIMTRCSGRA